METIRTNTPKTALRYLLSRSHLPKKFSEPGTIKDAARHLRRDPTNFTAAYSENEDWEIEELIHRILDGAHVIQRRSDQELLFIKITDHGHIACRTPHGNEVTLKLDDVQNII